MSENQQNTETSEIDAALERLVSRVEETRRAEQEQILTELRKHLDTPAPEPPPTPEQQGDADDLPDENLPFNEYMRTYKTGIAAQQARATAELLQYTKIATDEARNEIDDLVSDGTISKEKGNEILNMLHQALLENPENVVQNVKLGHHLGFIARATHDDLKKARKAAKAAADEVITGAGTGSVRTSGGSSEDPRSKMAEYLKERGYDLDPAVAAKWKDQ